MKIDLLKALLVCLLIFLASPITMESTPSYKVVSLQAGSFGQNLGFNNQTGSSTTDAQVSSFINFVNSASTFYRDDTQARLQYISDKMNQTYETSQNGFSVIQMDNETNWSWAVVTYSSLWASFARGIDRIFPQNSYVFFNQPIGAGRVYLNAIGQKGQGITSNLQNIIRNIILSFQTSSTCQCLESTTNIWSKLYQYDASYWNVLCSESITFYGAVYHNKGRYIYFKPKNCYYAIYATSSQ